MLKTLPLCLCAAALALSACNQSASDNNGGATAQPDKAAEAAGDKTIAAALDQNGKFFQAAKAVGLDGTLAGPGPYTVLVPDDAAFAKAEGDALKDPANPQNRAEITRVLTYHILPGVILADDISKAIDTGKGKAILATMGGQNLRNQQGNHHRSGHQGDQWGHPLGGLRAGPAQGRCWRRIWRHQRIIRRISRA
jgi:uncharacterized surface protein with fasciclin (FAS1) repeats